MRTVRRLHVQVHDVLRVQEVQPPRHIQGYLLAQARLSLPVCISAPAVRIGTECQGVWSHRDLQTNVVRCVACAERQGCRMASIDESAAGAAPPLPASHHC